MQVYAGRDGASSTILQGSFQNQIMQQQKKIIRGYEVHQMLGSGSYGVVYLATKDGQSYGLKEQAYVDRREEELYHKIKRLTEERKEFTKNVIKYFDYFFESQKHYFVMEFANGGDLYNYFNQNQLDEKQALEIALQVSHGLRWLHMNDYIHRDLKPENVLVSKSDGKVVFKICDFNKLGLGLSERQTINVGSPYYQAPELITQSNYNKPIDIWALGAIIFELCEKKPLFNGTDIKTVQSEILSHQLSTMKINDRIASSKFFSQLTKFLIQKMLNPKPNERPTIDQVIAEIECIRKTPIIDYPPKLKVITQMNVHGNLPLIKNNLGLPNKPHVIGNMFQNNLNLNMLNSSNNHIPLSQSQPAPYFPLQNLISNPLQQPQQKNIQILNQQEFQPQLSLLLKHQQSQEPTKQPQYQPQCLNLIQNPTSPMKVPETVASNPYQSHGSEQKINGSHSEDNTGIPYKGDVIELKKSSRISIRDGGSEQRQKSRLMESKLSTSGKISADKSRLSQTPEISPQVGPQNSKPVQEFNIEFREKRTTSQQQAQRAYLDACLEELRSRIFELLKQKYQPNVIESAFMAVQQRLKTHKAEVGSESYRNSFDEELKEYLRAKHRELLEIQPSH